MKIIKYRVWDIQFKRYLSGPTEYRLINLPESYIFQEFTGVLDKNGEEIYIGDILSFHFPGHRKYENAEVIWSEEYLTYLVKFHFGKEYWSKYLSDSVNSNQEFSVIGNIFQDSGLLENNPHAVNSNP